VFKNLAPQFNAKLIRFAENLVQFGSMCGLGLSADLDADAVEESALKVDLLFNFARFTNGPCHAFADSTVKECLCVFGGEAPGEAFSKPKDKPVETGRVGL